MNVLVPIDGSDCSFRALRFATDFVRRYEGSIHVVHITDYEGKDTEKLLEKAEKILDEEGLKDDPEIVIDMRLHKLGSAGHAGDRILQIVEEKNYDHVVMGHHGSGAVERIILGSATQKVIKADEVPVTVIP